MIFLLRKLLFQPPDQGWRNRGPRRNFCGGIRWFFRYFEFFFNAVHIPIRVDHLCSRQTSRDLFWAFLSSRFWPLSKKKPKSKFGKNHFRPPNFPLWVLNVLRSKRSTVVFQAKFLKSRLRRRPKVSVLGEALHIQKTGIWKEKLSETVLINRPIVPTDETWI